MYAYMGGVGGGGGTLLPTTVLELVFASVFV